MNAKDLLQMNATLEQYVAFSTLMKGELNTEIQAAQQALSDLSAAQDLVALKTSLTTQQAAFEQYKQDVQNHFKEQDGVLADRIAALDARESSIASVEKQLATAQGDLQVAQNALEIAKQAFANDQSKAQQELQDAQTTLDNDRAVVSAAQHSIIMREQEVNRKLEVLRNL